MILGLGKPSQSIYVSTTPGRVPHTKGKEPSAIKFKVGKLFVKDCLKFIIIHNQVSLGASETLVGKRTFEALVHSFGFSALSYHGNNGIFASQAFKDDCSTECQRFSFSESGAHHQNGLAE